MLFGGPGDTVHFVRFSQEFQGSRGWGSFCEVFYRIAHQFVKDFRCTAHFSLGFPSYHTFFFLLITESANLS